MHLLSCTLDSMHLGLRRTIAGDSNPPPRTAGTRVILSGCPIDYPTLLTGLQTGQPLEVLGVYSSCIYLAQPSVDGLVKQVAHLFDLFSVNS